MASEGGDSKNISTIVDNDEEDVQFGFKRSEILYSRSSSTIGPLFERGVFVSYKSDVSWFFRNEAYKPKLLPKLLAEAIRTREADMKVKVRLTVFEGSYGGKIRDGDVLIFPDMINYRNIKVRCG